MITDINQLDPDGYYTYADYLTWKFKERVELFRGRLFKMSPAPNRKHQGISVYLSHKIYQALEGKRCKIYTAPFDVRLPIALKKGQGDTVVQPDITVVCDASKLGQRGCNGAPDLVMEILSPGNSKREMKHKLRLYEAAGIPEYWVVDPVHENIIIYYLNGDGEYVAGPPYCEGDTATTSIIPHWTLDVTAVFEQ